MDIAAESDESRSLVRVAIWAGQNAHDPSLYSEEAFIRGNSVTIHVQCRSTIHIQLYMYMYYTYTRYTQGAQNSISGKLD